MLLSISQDYLEGGFREDNELKGDRNRKEILCKISLCT